MIHPDVHSTLVEELDTAFPNPEESLGSSALADLPYLNAVVNESLRLGVLFGGMWRQVPKEGMMIEGIFIPGGTIVSVPTWAQQTDPQNFWPRPLEFVPERWLPGGLGPNSRLEPAALLAFSFGKLRHFCCQMMNIQVLIWRVGNFGCLGRTLALQQLRVVIARVVLEFEIGIPKGFDPVDYLQNIRNMRTSFFPSPLCVSLTKRRT